MELNKTLKEFGLYYDDITNEFVLAAIKEYTELNVIVLDMYDQYKELKLISQYDEISQTPGLLFKIKKEYKSRYN